jgi:CheY-like chemotaxis protein
MSEQGRIRVVDDELIVARDIAMLLQELGFIALSPANSGERAIEMARQLRPDLVLMDVRLASAMDGIEAAQTIRNHFGLPVVFLSASTGGGNTERAKLAEPAGYLSKPFSKHELRDVIASVFTDGRRSHR